MTGARLALATMIAGCALIVTPTITAFDKRLILNTTASAPLGFYWLGGGEPGPGDLALVRPPIGLARWMASRGYLPLNVPLIKRIAAVEGQAVCVEGDAVQVDGRTVGAVLRHDRLGRRLTASTVCRRLLADEVFLLNDEVRSLDGRYFGPLQRQTIAGRLTPVWTWER